jgi:EAL domain-containing protein (putative c-di-GMP-specific phosphodiesterase class I)
MMQAVRKAGLLDAFEPPVARAPAAAGDGITRMLRAIRTHLDMDVAFASEISDGQVIIRHADTAGDGPIRVGDVFPIEAGYCQRVVDGRLPELIPDTSAVPEAAALECTRTIPVGAHLSVPLKLSDGGIYGTFCCFSFKPNKSLNERDLKMLRAFADLAAGEIEDTVLQDRALNETSLRIRHAIERDGIAIVYQPIHRLDGEGICGIECLARFADCDLRPPSEWFAEAAEIGLGVELELAAVRAAIRGLPYLPDGLYVAVNVSPATILSGRLDALILKLPPGRVLLEITEHEGVFDYRALAAALEPLRQVARLAIDDVGAGYSGMRHIIDLKPDVIKLDMSLVRDIDRDPARRALALALVAFASGMDSEIVAEGVETKTELATLRELGIQKAQGYYLSRPMPLMAARQFITGERHARR